MAASPQDEVGAATGSNGSKPTKSQRQPSRPFTSIGGTLVHKKTGRPINAMGLPAEAYSNHRASPAAS